MPVLGLEVSTKDIDALFNEWDKDGGGSISYEELKKLLKGGPAVSSQPAKKKAPAKGRKPPGEEEEQVLDRASLKKQSGAIAQQGDPHA